VLHPYGWVESLYIIDAPVFRPDQRITFANLNVIVGGTGVGKTTICEWLCTLRDSSTLWRWGAYSPNTARKYHDVKVAIDFRAPARHHLVLEIAAGRTNFTLDKQNFPFSPVGYAIAALRGERFGGPSEGDQIFIAKCLRVDEIEIQALADYINESPGIFLKGTDWQDVEIDEGGDLVRCLYCKLPDSDGLVPFRALSGGETGAVLFDLAVARARLLAAYRPTLLIIETDGLSMTEEFLSLFLSTLSSPDTPFQSIVVTTRLNDCTVWGGWQVIRLNRAASIGVEGQFTEITVGDMRAAAS
jgi:hypothetical protein